jgi:hypothetical protein
MIKIPIIWNITNACFWNCPSCCVNAYYIPKDFEDKKMKLLEEGKELPLENKLTIVNNIDTSKIKVDASEGDPLIFKKNKIKYKIYFNHL